jgi:opacity protein-like surface antigen
MNASRWMTRTVAVLLAMLAPELARAAVTVIPPRAGQVGLAIQGQYGMLLDSGSLGTEFGQGPGLAVRLRYRMRYERGLGLSFESQRFDARTATVDDTLANHLSMFTYGVDAYQMFGTRTRTTRWLSVGGGLLQTRRVLNDKEIEFALNSDGVFVSAGAGVEQFFWQSWAFDLSTRYSAAFLDGKVNHDLQASLGFVFYASY